MSLLMLALEHSLDASGRTKVIAREVWRDFVDDLAGLPAEALARHLPQSLSRGGHALTEGDRQPLPRGASRADHEGEKRSCSLFTVCSRPIPEMEPDVFAPLNEADTMVGAELPV